MFSLCEMFKQVMSERQAFIYKFIKKRATLEFERLCGGGRVILVCISANKFQWGKMQCVVCATPLNETVGIDNVFKNLIVTHLTYALFYF